MHDPRSLILRALLLDSAGQLLILGLILWGPPLLGLSIGGSSLDGQGDWLLFSFLLYPLLGWLFGSYTVLRWRRLTLTILLQRLAITAAVSVMVVAVTRWLINPADSVWLVYRSVQFVWMFALTGWALMVRLALRRGLLLPESPRLFLLAQQNEIHTVLKVWQRIPHRQRLSPIDALRLQRRLDQSEQPLLVAVSSEVRRDPRLLALLENLDMQDPRVVRSMTVLSLFEQQQERLPPVLIGDISFTYDDLPWSSTLVFRHSSSAWQILWCRRCRCYSRRHLLHWQRCLFGWKTEAHFLFTAAQRLAETRFTVLKLRTMSVQPSNAPAEWTKVGDQRITAVGCLLRRVRLDELPQLLNVLNGEMSLIGPRPERPELEHQLELSIPHYRKRHWMRPGLSGWAQVCAPYASSIEDSDLKLSYDLYYLRHFSTWLDLVILFRTIKTVLKAGGR